MRLIFVVFNTSIILKSKNHMHLNQTVLDSFSLVLSRPVWRDELTQLTGYALPDVVECGEELWNFYEKMFPLHKVGHSTYHQ